MEHQHTSIILFIINLFTAFKWIHTKRSNYDTFSLLFYIHSTDIGILCDVWL